MVKQTEIPLTAWLITPLITGCIIKFYQKKLIRQVLNKPSSFPDVCFGAYFSV